MGYPPYTNEHNEYLQVEQSQRSSQVDADFATQPIDLIRPKTIMDVDTSEEDISSANLKAEMELE